MTQEQIIDFANKMVAKGSAMTFEQLVAMKNKEIAKKGKKSAKAWAKRDEQKEILKTLVVRSSEEIYAELSKKCLPSSMRD